jgi:hypothetical protein
MALNFKALKDKQENRRGGSGWQAKDGNNLIRVLPPASAYFGGEIEDIAHSFKVHFLKKEGEDTKVTRCYRDKKTTCPVCEVWFKFRKSDDPALAKMANEIRGVDRFLLNILDMNNLQAGVQQYTANYTVYNGILEYAANPMWGDVLSPEAGRNFFVELTLAAKSKTGFNSYKVQPDPQASNITGILAQLPGWQEKLDELAAQVNPYLEAEELQAFLDKVGFPPDLPRASVPGHTFGAPAGWGQPSAPQQPLSPPPAFAPPPQPGFPAPTYSAPAAAPVAAPAAPVYAPPVQPAPAPEPEQPSEFTAEPSWLQQAPAAAPVAAPAAPVYAPPAQPVAVPQPVVAAPVQPTPVAAPVMMAAAPVAPEAAPAGHPACFGDFDPRRHPCDGCPSRAECQIAALGL